MGSAGVVDRALFVESRAERRSDIVIGRKLVIGDLEAGKMYVLRDNMKM